MSVVVLVLVLVVVVEGVVVLLVVGALVWCRWRCCEKVADTGESSRLERLRLARSPSHSGRAGPEDRQ